MSEFSYTVRVELHKVPHDEPVYKHLHSAMEAKGFSRTIIGSIDGKTYHLPPAEYRLVTSSTWEKVLAMAKDAANSVMNDPNKSAVTVTQSVGFWINNLEPVLAPLSSTIRNNYATSSRITKQN